MNVSDDFSMSHLGDGIVQIEFKGDGSPCLHQVPWREFVNVVLLTDYAVKNGDDALERLVAGFGKEVA